MNRVILLICAISLTGCSWWNPNHQENPGNPSNTPYAGEPGGIFDANSGPLRPVQPEPNLGASYDAPMPSSQAPVASGQLPPLTPR